MNIEHHTLKKTDLVFASSIIIVIKHPILVHYILICQVLLLKHWIVWVKVKEKIIMKDADK